MLLVYFVIAAIPIGYLLGGRLRNYLRNPLKFVLLPCVALLIEASFGWIDAHIGLDTQQWLGWAVCLEYALLGVFIWQNRKLRGVKLLGLATLTNFIVMLANGFRMPVTPLIYEYPALASFVERIQAGELPEYVLVDWNAPLWFLGDTIPIFGGLASIGDLLMAVGILVIIVGLMKSPEPASPAV